MKILALRFKNLNSLYGEWQIDFTHPEYSSNGIFAITGPTGAGKSTILDALCLALYGTTPRLGKLSKSSNELMSQQTGDCFAEVTFQTQTGTFRSHWSQQRARKKADGKLGDACHEISDALTGQLLESKKREVAAVIEAKTGMDFERFTRSIMLAQGGFSAFLTACADERAPILEQITGTEIYSEISKRLHEHLREQREKHKVLCAEIASVSILSMEQEERHQLALNDKQLQQDQLYKQMQATKNALAWLATINHLSDELTLIEQEKSLLNTELSTIAHKKEQLTQAQKAAELQGLYAELVLLRQQQQQDERTFNETLTQLPELDSILSMHEEALGHAQQRCSELKLQHKSQARLIQKVRLLDQQREEQINATSLLEQECLELNERIGITEKQAEHRKREIQSIQVTLQQHQNYLEHHAQDALLLSQLAAIEEQAKQCSQTHQNVLNQQQRLLVIEQQLKQAKESVLAHEQQLAKHQQHHSSIQNHIIRHKQQLSLHLGDRLLREYRSDKDNLFREMALLHKIANLEDERSQLQPGLPCPLCGATTHPFAQQTIPELSKTEQKLAALTVLIEEAEQQEQQISHWQEQEHAAIKQINLLEQLKATALNQQENTSRELNEHLVQAQKLQTDYDSLTEEILSRLSLFDIKIQPNSGVQEYISELQQRLKLWQHTQQQQIQQDKQLVLLNNELNNYTAFLQQDKKILAERQTLLKQHISTNHKLQLEREALFGVKNPDKEEELMEEALIRAEQTAEKTQMARDHSKQQQTAYTIKSENLKNQINARAAQLERVHADFINSFSYSGIKNEQEFISYLLPAEARDNLIKEIKAFDRKTTELELKAKDRQQRLKTEQEKQLTQAQMGELDALAIEQEQALKAIKDDMAILSIELTNHHTNKQKIKEQKLLIARQNLECTKLEKLHALIGSADGKKYRNFAQGLTFELMVFHANKQLAKMTERYLLVRDHEKPLELNVVDNYQAGEIRTTKNLSGGEGFIVSLALALGLSKMSSQKVRVDSLFLDEGFGTLDDEALETALDTLSQLQQDGKIIGIISHVPALKERISTQINVQPITGGRSHILGPGCSS